MGMMSGFIYTAEDMVREKRAGEFAAHETTRKRLATMEQEHKTEMETVKREHEAQVEVLKGRVAISHHTYTDSAAQTEVALDETTALQEETPTPPDEIPTREEGGRESYTRTTASQTEDRRRTVGLWIK